MVMQNTRPGDVYADSSGKLWRVRSVFREPTVWVEEVEPEGRRRVLGGEVGAKLWDGFQCVYRQEEGQKADG